METVSEHSMTSTTEPVYDYPNKETPCSPSLRESSTSVSITDKLLLTQSVWLHLSVNSATALHVLQREPPGTFLVRRSNIRQQLVLCVRLSDDCGPSFIHQAYIHEGSSGLFLEHSTHTFPDLIRLVSYYSCERDVLPYTLRLPAAIEKVTSKKELEAISNLGHEFWNSSLNARDNSSTPNSSATSLTLSLTPLPHLPDTISPTLVPALKTRSPKEVSLTGKEGALFFLNPLFKSKDSGALKRSHFQKSIKVRVSTENSGSLSPPLNPPPPVPCEEAVKEEEEVVSVEAPDEPKARQTEELSEDQAYRKPRSSLRQRLRKSLSKGSRDFGIKLSPMRSKDVGDYNVPSTVTRTQDVKDAKENNVNGVSALEEHDSGSISSAEDITSEDGVMSPQLTRRKKKKSGRSSFRAVSGAFLSLLSPERKIMILIEEMGKDVSTEFGKELQAFLQNMELSKNKDVKHKTQDGQPTYKTLLKNVRDFMDRMKHMLRESTEMHLETLIPDEQERVLEKSLHRLTLKPLKTYLMSEIQREMEEKGELERLEKNMQSVKNGGSSLLGVKLKAPVSQDLEKIRQKLLRMQLKCSPCDKVRLLLQACRGVYKSMDTQQDDACGADEFLPALCYVLALCELPQILTDTQYTIELLPQESLMGEGGYYLTSVSASLSVLCSLHTHPQDAALSLSEWHRRRQGLASLNDLQNFLRVAHQDPVNGCTTKTILLKPSQTVADLIRLCALKFKPSKPEDFSIFLHCGGDQQLLPMDAHPQEIKSKLKETGSSFFFCYQRTEEDATEKVLVQRTSDLLHV
ncbi:PREDICTED: ras and Rab interactor 1 [Nanorana parkeri]|uniref:ras and Rab interactor 1 n=1 Tax=Nanorana parkeri TaxID=125878 RepID=UPI00085479EB|nr:PREDICTED: ras and Rab interactor 1 [Nanorana parkeri]